MAAYSILRIFDSIWQLKSAATVIGDISCHRSSNCPNLLIVSLYDTKPVHFLSPACTNLYEMKMKKGCMIRMLESTLSCSVLMQNSYNRMMSHVDHADQWRDNTYWLDKWIGNRMWLWAKSMQGIKIILVNASMVTWNLTVISVEG